MREKRKFRKNFVFPSLLSDASGERVIITPVNLDCNKKFVRHASAIILEKPKQSGFLNGFVKTAVFLSPLLLRAINRVRIIA